jgi:hypothetical protein
MRLALAMAAMMLVSATPAVADGSPATIYRGPGSGPLPKLPSPPVERVIAAGKTLWVARPDGRVTACRLEGTYNVGQRVSVCADPRRLPGF